MNQEQLFSIFSERFCPEADFAYRFCMAVTLDPNKSAELTKKAFEMVAADLPQHTKDEYPGMTLITRCAREILGGTKKSAGKTGKLDPVVADLAKITEFKARMALAAEDLCGLSLAETAQLITGNKDDTASVSSLLGVAREVFYGGGNQPVPQELWAIMTEVVDDNIQTENQVRFDQLRKSAVNFDQVVSHFRLRRGQLQLAIQEFQLSAKFIEDLRNLVATPDIRHTQEATRIEAISNFEARRRFLRQASFASVAIAIIVGIAIKTAPPKPKLNTLEVLSYESLALFEDGQDRLDLPTDNIEEVKEYLSSYPELGFKPKVLTTSSTGFAIEGASVLDYDPAKVAVVVYKNPNGGDKILYFTMTGQTADLPRAEPGNHQGLIYQTYASDSLNMIAWNPTPGILAIAAGSKSAPDLADFVRKGELGM